MRCSFEHPCEDGHQLAPSDEPHYYRCERCGMGLWEVDEATEDFDVDAYAHALGMQEISGGVHASGTTLPVRMVSEEISEPLSLSGMKHRAERPPTRSNCSPAAPPAVGEHGPQAWRRTVQPFAPAGQPFAK